MQVTIRLSGELARMSGTPRVGLDLPDGATVADAREAVVARMPDLSGAIGHTLPLVRGTHVAESDVLAPGDELALLLPAAGG